MSRVVLELIPCLHKQSGVPLLPMCSVGTLQQSSANPLSCYRTVSNRWLHTTRPVSVSGRRCNEADSRPNLLYSWNLIMFPFASRIPSHPAPKPFQPSVDISLLCLRNGQLIHVKTMLFTYLTNFFQIIVCVFGLYPSSGVSRTNKIKNYYSQKIKPK
jgi:hypothetical protein